MDIREIGHKIENGGVSAQGKLSAEEFNTVLDKVVELMTLGGHDDMNAGVDGVATDDVALVKRAGTEKWAVMKLSDILGGVDVSQKFGDASYEDGTISFLDEPGGTVLQTVTLSGTIYNINIATNVAQVFSVLTGDEHKIITITPTTTAGAIGETPEDFPESYSYVVAVDTGSGYVPRFSGTIPVGGTGSFDIRSALVVGTNRIRISVTGDQSETTKTRILTATLTNLALSCSHAWQTPWMEGSDYTIGGIYFQGNIAKTLHIKVGSTEFTKDYRESESFPTVATTYTLYASSFPELSASGTVHIEMWMTGESVETPHIHMNIMCVQTGDTTPLVCINEVADSAVNFTQGTLFKYAVYGASSVNIATTVLANGTYNLPDQEAAVVPGQQYTFATALEVETEETSGTLTSVVTPYSGTTAGTASSVTLPLDNSHAFLPVAGAVFYMNAALRANTEADRLVWRNTAPGAQVSSYPTVMSGFTFNGDAWDTDPDGHKAFAVPARCRCEVPLLTPFATTGGMMGVTGITIEMLVRCSNIADYDTPVLSFMDNSGLGLKLYPTKVVILGSSESSEELQGVGLCEDIMTHITIVLQRNYGGKTGWNLCSIYLNGIPNVTFSFGSTSLFGNGSLLIGQDRSDFYLYSMRIHDKALDGQDVKADMLNAIIDGVILDREAARTADAIREGSAIEYQLVKNLGYNIMVVDPNDDQLDIPSFDNKVTLPDCTVRFEYWSQPEWNVQIDHVPIDGQGTTSKQYYRWNLRGKLDDSAVWTYADGTTTTGKKGYMDGGKNGGAHGKIDRWTAKKNIASMPQGHKMGATALYDDLFTEIGLKSELPSSSFRVAVWQRPFLGFRRYSNGAYEFIGLYTAGPDKGCKTTFGYDKSAYPAAMCIEGPNHDPRGTRFLHPWVDVDYDYEEETLTFGGQEGWDCDYCKFGTDKASDQASVLALYTSEWKPAYDFVFHCSPYIESLSAALTAGGYADVEALNADIDSFKASSTNGVSNLLLSFYDSNYDIWYLRNKTGLLEKLVRQDGDSQDGLWNILTYLDDYLTTSTPTTAQIRAARTAKFKAELSDYFSVDQTLYHKAFCLLIGAKDNDAKNSYPFKHLALASGGRWGWKQDDLDSIFGVDNNGQSTVQYWVEPGDKANSVEIFQGCDSAFWYHIWLAYQDELRTMFGRIESACVSIATREGILGGRSYESVYNVLDMYFFGSSAKYFPMTAYQEDRVWAYITPWLIDPTKVYNNVYPLTQAIGDRYLDERYWIERRIMYLFSKYRIGAFTGENAGWNRMAFTIARDVVFTFNVVPALAHYPVANLGGSGAADVQGARTFPTGSTGITLTSSGATTVYIKATDWLASLGDLCGLELTSRSAGESIPFAVVSERMKVLKVGDADPSNVVFNATLLTVAGPCFEDIDARNVVSLTGTVDLSGCPRLRKALFEGCTGCNILLPAGSRVSEVSFPEALTTLFLHSLINLTDSNLNIGQAALANINNYYFDNCPYINPITILAGIFAGSTNSLIYATIIMRETTDITSEEVEALYTLATGTYGRLDYEDGIVSPSMTPGALVQGTVRTEWLLQSVYDAICEAFPGLTILYDKLYLEFEDPEVWRICCTNWGDYEEVVTTIDSNAGTTTIVTTPVSMLNTTPTRGTSTTVTRPTETEDVAGTVKVPVGITQVQCAAVSSLGTIRVSYNIFADNKTITSFREFKEFTGIIELWGSWALVQFGNFNNCSNLIHIEMPESLQILGDYAFSNCSSLQILEFGENLNDCRRECFKNLRCPIIIHATTPPALNTYDNGNAATFYVPDASVDAYKAADGWSSWASRIKPLSEYDS